MLRRQVLLDTAAIRVAEVTCSGDGDGWGPIESVTAFGLVLVRRGVFRRVVDGVHTVLDSTVGYVQRPGQVQRIAHPAGADTCTSIAVDAPTAERFDRVSMARLDGETDLTHRMLVARAHHGADATELTDLATELLRAAAGDRATPTAGSRARGLADDARALLAVRPELRLEELAAELGVSPWHLSRTFHAATGLTLSRHRRRLRTRAALSTLADRPATPLATLAAETGFADQAHLTRAARAETGHPPAALRTLLAPNRSGLHPRSW